MKLNAILYRPLVALALIGGCTNGSGCDKHAPKTATSPQQPLDVPAIGVQTDQAQLIDQLQQARLAKGPAYKPRTRHLQADGSPTYTNRLILETSPYLLQHAHNPVDWRPWGPQAFEQAAKQDKPVLVSIGYSTCHWCHVMEHESFEDEEVAAYINAHFIAIKVDREERPDIDSTYMKAVQMLTGRGGWPMTVVLTPDKDPFFGGTYFPARDGDRGARRGFLSILRELSETYQRDHSSVVSRAQALSQRIESSSISEPGSGLPEPGLIKRVVERSARVYDGNFGGFGRAPKFPRPALPELILRYQRRTGDPQALAMVTHTLRRMAAGGIYDQVGGGFHRYSTDDQWLVPHFEKMLYDNAQLVPLYLDAYQSTGELQFAQTARDTLRYISREMTHQRGAFFSATDADSLGPTGHQEEGYYFSWTPDEIERVLDGRHAKAVTAYFAIKPHGNFEGRTILSRPRSDQTVAAELGLTVPQLLQTISESRDRLYAARGRRPAPLRDDKVLASWNGLMISAFARAAMVLGDGDYRARAEKAATFVLTEMRNEQGHLLRSYKDGQARQEGYLDDYAFVIQGLLDLFEVTSNPHWLKEGRALQQTLDNGFWDPRALGYFMTSEHHEVLLARDKPYYDGAEPSGNSVAILNLLRWADMSNDRAMRDRANLGLTAFATDLRRSPSGSPKMLCALERSVDRVREVFIVLPASGGDAEPLLSVVRKTYLPNRVFAVVRQGADLAALRPMMPALKGKQALKGRATAYVCEQGRCELPTHDPTVLANQLSASQPLPTQ